MQNLEKEGHIAGCCPTVSGCKTWQISLLRGRAHSVSVSCCPIEVSEFEQPESVPDDATDQGKQTGETMRPLTLKGDKTKQNIQEQSRPPERVEMNVVADRSECPVTPDFGGGTRRGTIFFTFQG